MRHTPEFDPEPAYPVIDGPLKGQYVAQPGNTFLAVLPEEHPLVAYSPSAVPVNKTVPTVRYYLWFGPRGMKVWSIEATE